MKPRVLAAGLFLTVSASILFTSFADSGSVPGWSKIKHDALESVSPPEQHQVIVRYHKKTEVNWRGTPGMDFLPDITMDEWEMELQFAGENIFFQEKLVAAQPARGLNGEPRLPIRHAVSSSDGESRILNVFEELNNSESPPPKYATMVELRLGERLADGLPFVLTRNDFQRFLARVENAVVSKEAGSENSWTVSGDWTVNGDFRENNKVAKRMFLQFAQSGAQLYLTQVIGTGGVSDMVMRFENWKRITNGYSFPEKILVEQKNRDGEITSRNSYLLEYPPEVKSVTLPYRTAEVPARSAVEDFRLGERVYYEAGARLPTVDELKAMLREGAAAKNRYFHDSMKIKTRSGQIPVY